MLRLKRDAFRRLFFVPRPSPDGWLGGEDEAERPFPLSGKIRLFLLKNRE